MAAYHPRIDLSGFYKSYESGENALKELEPGSLVFTRFDGPTFKLWYFQHVVHRGEKEIRAISMPLLGFSWYLYNLRQAYPSGTKDTYLAISLWVYKNIPS